MSDIPTAALEAFCRAIRDDDVGALPNSRREFVAHNWSFVRALDQIAEANFRRGAYDPALQGLELLEQLLPESGGIFLRRVLAAFRAGRSGALEELAAGSGRFSNDPELFSAVEELVGNGRPELATQLIADSTQRGKFSAGIIAACRSRVLARAGRIGEALRCVARDEDAELNLTAMRCRYLLLEQLLEFDEAQIVALQAALHGGEEREVRYVFDQAVFAFDYHAALDALSTIARHHPGLLALTQALAADLRPAREAAAAAVQTYGPPSNDPAVIFDALSKPGIEPTRILWGKLSLIGFLRSGKMTEIDYVRFAWFLPNWEQAPVRHRVLSAARLACPDTDAVQLGWLSYLIAIGAYGDAAIYCDELLAKPADDDTLFFVTLLLRLQQDATVPPFMDAELVATLTAKLQDRLPEADPGFRCVLHDHFASLGMAPGAWTTDEMPAHDHVAGRGFRRLLAVTTGRLNRVSVVSPAKAPSAPVRPVLAISGQLRGFETAWASLHRHLVLPTGAPLVMSVWDKSVNAKGRHARRLERTLPDDIIQALRPEERYTDTFETAYPATARLLFGETDVDAASLHDLVSASSCNVLALETESERLLEQVLHPHVSPNMLKMYYKFARLHALIQEAEVRSGELFSHVIWARPDCEIVQLGADDLRACLARRDIVWSSFVTETSFGDYAMVLPRDAFATIASIFARVCLSGDTRLLPWRPNRSANPGERSSLDAFGGPDVLFDMLLADGYMPISRIPRMVVNLRGRTPEIGRVRQSFKDEMAAAIHV